MVRKSVTASTGANLPVLRRKVESIEKLLRGNAAPGRVSAEIMEQVRSHLHDREGLTAADLARLQSALARVSALMSRQLATLRKGDALVANIIANLRS